MYRIKGIGKVVKVIEEAIGVFPGDYKTIAITPDGRTFVSYFDQPFKQVKNHGSGIQKNFSISDKGAWSI